MGLDTALYRNCHVVDSADDFDTDFDFYVDVCDGLANNCEKLELGKRYKGEKVGRYVSYAYSGHSEFRKLLCQLVGADINQIWNNPANYVDTPFFRIVNFPDNEGIIDWAASEILYSNFMEYKEQAEKELAPEWFNFYMQWLELFKLGKQEGYVIEIH